MSHDVTRTAPTFHPTGENKSIFRSKALRSYSHRDQQSVSHTLITQRSLYLLWALLALVVSLGVITWLIKIPIYTQAIGVGTAGRASQDEATVPALIAVMVPAHQLNKVRSGQDVVFKLNDSNGTPHRITGTILAVESEVLSPQAAQKRFDPGISFSNIGEPKAVAWARVPAGSSALLLNNRGGAIDAWIQTDSKPVVSLFPLMGRTVHPSDEQRAIRATACSGLARVSHVRKGEFFERYPGRALSCLLREKSLQIKNKKQNEGGTLYV